MKAICKKQFKVLAGILDEGDIVEIEPVLSEKDEIIVNKTNAEQKNPFILSIPEDTIRPAGSFLDYKFKAKNGQYYNGDCIKNAIGNTPLNKIFKKI